MKSPVQQGNRRENTQPVTVVNNTKYIAKLSERTIPKGHYTTDEDLQPETFNRFFHLYGIICLYILLIFGIMIGAGGIAMCIAYFNSGENTQNWKIGGIVLGAITCIVTIILMIVTIFKQTRNQPWRYQVKDILLHPEHYFHDDLDQVSSEDLDDDDGDDENNQTVETTLSPAATPSIGLLKTVHDDLVYCLGCNRLHSSAEECIKPQRVLPPLQRSRSLHAQRNSNAPRKAEESEKESKSRTIIDRSIKYSLANETQTDVSGNTADNLILRRVPTANTNVIAQQAATKIMIVRVPNVPGELVLQAKEH